LRIISVSQVVVDATAGIVHHKLLAVVARGNDFPSTLWAIVRATERRTAGSGVIRSDDETS
jgi:hypothetical protein